MPVENIVHRADAGITRAEAAYRTIRDAILSDRLRVNEHLREESLAQHLRMSRTPIREALGRLRTEGLVQEAKPRGYIVSAVSATEVFHVYAVREVLEGYCHRLAAERITSHQLFELATIVEQMEQAVDDPRWFSKLNHDFHAIIFAATDNPILQKIMDDLLASVQRFPVSAYEVEGRARQALIEHRQILDALTSHDAAAAEAAVSDHLRVGLEARLVALRRHTIAADDTRRARNSEDIPSEVAH